jgi:hypothetical protein
MAHVLAVGATGTPVVTIAPDERTGSWDGTCDLCPWTIARSVDDRYVAAEDAIGHAVAHVDDECPGRPGYVPAGRRFTGPGHLAQTGYIDPN